MAILITGGAGYIGSHMVYELADRGVVIDDFSSGFEWAIPSGVSVFVGDVADHRRVASLIARYGISEIIHFAASVVVSESVAEPLRYYRNNTANSRSLFEVATSVAPAMTKPRSVSTGRVFAHPVMRRGTSRDRELCFASTTKQADRCRSWVKSVGLSFPRLRPVSPGELTSLVAIARSQMGHYRTHTPLQAMRHQRHSITSSARASSAGGTVRPSTFAVLRLITSSNLVGCSTGRSAGFTPFRMWSM